MKNILVVEHMACQNPGVFRDLAAANGVAFHEIDPHAGDVIPSLDGFDGLWVMGGSMNVWEVDEHPWLTPEKTLIHEAVTLRGLPFFGICLGHQLLAEVLGGRVEPSARREIGLVPIEATAAGSGHPLLGGLTQPSTWVNVHLAEVTQAPAGATVLARSADCDNHVMQVGSNAFSVQFHPEVNEDTLPQWMTIPGIPESLRDWLGAPGLEQFHSSIAAYLPRHKAAATQLFRNWLDAVFDNTEGGA